MGQQNKRSSLTLAVDTFDAIMPIDTSTRHVNRKSNSTPTPVNTMVERRRSKSSVPALEELKNLKEESVKGYMKGRRPRKEPVMTQLQEGEADQTNDDSPQSPKKNKIVFTKIFKKSTKSSSPTTKSSPVEETIVVPTVFVPPTTTASGKRVKITGAYVHTQNNRTLAQSSPTSSQIQTTDRLRSKSSPVMYSNETSMVVGGYIHKRAQTDPIPDMLLTLTPPAEEPTLTKNKYSSPFLPSIELPASSSSKSLDEEPFFIVIDEHTTYMEMPLTKKNGIIIKKKKEKLKEMVQVYYLQKDELVNRTRREMAKSKRRR
ncbi:predicted protein [Naegleria gruberi]|uniref:Predicted protein n=1 Tax=Naegleria gruberi TaxID=5762 RepID=D2VM23_NAEGR|nr:uncharacterized protein NAEGRDRAFT_80503 [Naegleria gruberi]EFC42152.1 predicted protein [Naegleria gruberi]|eukprot:XP_002674896.1 predicted protein [Naegleria gruberi strain NEG-M]